MRSLTSLETSILRSHPDELRGNVEALLYLAQPGNAPFLAEYEATWAEPIAARRLRSPNPQSPCSSSSVSPS